MRQAPIHPLPLNSGGTTSHSTRLAKNASQVAGYLPTGEGGQNQSAKPVIEVNNLQRRFGSFYAVNNISFTVSRGEVFGLLGANGAGKSTTFRMLCGLLPPSGGTPARRGCRPAPRGSGRACAHRLHVAEILALRQSQRGREPAFLQQRLRPVRRAPQAAHGLGAAGIRTGADGRHSPAATCRSVTSSGWRSPAR